MDPIPSKRLKTAVENGVTLRTQEEEEEEDDIEYEMLIDEDLEGTTDDARRNESDESTTTTSSSSSSADRVKTEEEQQSAEDVKPVKLVLDVKLEPMDSDEGSHHDEEEVKLLLLQKYPRYCTASGRQFIAVEQPILSRVRQLCCSSLLDLDGGMNVCLHNLGCLMLIDDRFIAKLEPMDVGELRQATGFEQAREILLSKLRIARIVQDDATVERDRNRTALLDQIQRSDASDAAQILEIVQRSSSDLKFIELCEQLLEARRPISGALKEPAENLLRIEREIKRRNEFLVRFTDALSDDTQALNETLKEFCKGVISKRLKFVLESTPSFLRDQLKDAAEGTIFRIHDDDVAAFCAVEKTLTAEIFRKPLEDLAKRWIDRVSALERSVPLVSSTFVSLLRSLEELTSEIVEDSEHSSEELLSSDQRGWHRLDVAISWRSQSSLTSCFEREYNFVVRLLNHFDPAAGTVDQLEYQPKRSFEAIPNEHFVWFCLLDDVLDGLELGPFNQIVTNFVKLLQKTTCDQVEKIRIMTHSVCRFISQTLPLVSSAKEDEDDRILQSQLDVIDRAMLGCAFAFRDLLDELSCFWKFRCKIIEQIPRKNALPDAERLKNSLLTIAAESLRKSVEIHDVITWLRTFNDFLLGLADVSFDWLVKSLPNKPRNAAIALEYIEPVANQAYRVIEPIKFRQLFTVLLEGVTCPRHYSIDVVGKWLACVKLQLERANWSQADQLASARVLIATIRESSLSLLHDQSEYVSYEQILEDFVRPFCNLLEHSHSLEDFTRRAGLIGKSFGRLRRQNEVCLSEALQMLGKLNDGFSGNVLKHAYQQYLNNFHKCVMEIEREPVQPTPLEDWTSTFKRNKLPKIVAAVAAAWFAKRSSKPTCVQILAVLCLLGVDTDEAGIAKHLARIDRGRSLVLAMIAAILALTGHRALVVCANGERRRRYAKDYAGLFEGLGVTELIRVGSYDDMVDAIIAPPQVGAKATVELQSLVSDLILWGNPPKLKVQTAPVLLVDETDVFFDKEYYGNAFCLGAFPCVPGLDQIQEKIWNLVRDLGLRNVQEVTTQIEQYICSPQFSSKAEFHKFLDYATPYDLIVLVGAKHVRKQFTNRSLFHEELKPMIENAISVATDSAEHADYRLNAQGAITYRDRDRFVTWSVPGYKSVFNYFRLKQHNFDLKVSCTPNYGYLNVSCGLFSYALFPAEFPLILALTKNQPTNALQPTLERLYAIDRASTLEISPTFPRLTHLPTKTLWMNKISTQAKATSAANRPVFVVFETSAQLEEFRDRYYSFTDCVTLTTCANFKSNSDAPHVIQTFFSVTAGRVDVPTTTTCELILFDGYLRQDGLIGAAEFGGTYAELEEARAAIVAKERERIAEKVKESEGDHRTTMRYLRSFFE